MARLNGQLDKKLLSVEVPMAPPPTDRWEYKPQIQQPAATEGFVEIPIDQIEFREITTPDGTVHLAPFPKGSPPIEGGYISYPEENEKLIAPKSYFVLENVQVPEGENLEDYQVKTLLAAAHGISMEEVEEREMPMEEQRSLERPRRLGTPPAPSVPEAPQAPNIEQ